MLATGMVVGSEGPKVLMIRKLLLELSPGCVRLVLCPQVERALGRLDAKLAQLPTGVTVIARTWDRLPGVSTVIADGVHGLADSARALWPDWYAGCLDCDGRIDSQRLAERGLAFAGQPQTRHSVLHSWLETAGRLCRSGRTPLSADFPNATQAVQLALALAPERLILVLAATDPAPAAGSLLGLARAAEWFAREIQACVAVLLPAPLANHAELDGINFSAVPWDADSNSATEQRDSEEKSRLLIRPLLGRPHPDSRGEQLLAEWLQLDPELADLFRFNQSVTSVRDHRFLVDLLWPAGRVVVEVDGYRWHSDRQAFIEDRRRDYELLISGYLVLRLPHDEILADVELAISKIRDVVAFRRQNSATVIGDD